jgi:uncharacterized protein (TIGR02147 family)
MEAPIIYQYLDYRTYLGDWIRWKKVSERGFSLRSFVQVPELSLSSSSFLSAVLKGRKNLSQSLRLRFARALGLDGLEVEYFELLVQYNQSRTADERDHYFAQVSRHHSSRARPLEGAEYRLFSRWYLRVIWHWLALHQDQHNPAQIAKALQPAITPLEADEAIRALLELRLIKRLANGYEVGERHLATDRLFAAAEATPHQREMLLLALDNLDRLPAEERQYECVSFSVSGRGFDRIRARMDSFRSELRDLVEADPGGDRVMALSMQLFPCTRAEAGWGRSSVASGNPASA